MKASYTAGRFFFFVMQVLSFTLILPNRKTNRANNLNLQIYFFYIPICVCLVHHLQKNDSKYQLYLKTLVTPKNTQFYSLWILSITYIQMYVYCKLCVAICYNEILVSAPRRRRQCRSVQELCNRIDRLQNCAFVGVTRVLIYHNAQNEQCKISYTCLTIKTL